LVDWVLRAYEADRDIPHAALIVLGPFMPADQRKNFQRRTQALDNVAAITFDAYLENLMHQSVAVVAMGGYNTFCEILSFDKPALLLPRVAPRREQLIRAMKARDLGLVATLDITSDNNATVMATALRHLPQQARPSSRIIPGLLDGLKNVNLLADRLLEQKTNSAQPLSIVDSIG
jgi:predicted glycosyltransferase